LAEECRSLGKFEVGIDPGVPGTVVATLKCLVDAAGTVEITCNEIEFKASLSSGLTQQVVDELIKTGQANVREKELKRRFILTLNRIDTILNQLSCHDYDQRRQGLQNWQEADLLLAELEEKFLPVFETKLIEKIQKYLSS
jgi:hypothetical protein